MAQYMAAKNQHPDAMLFFRMGDFYELFFEDAKEASRTLGIALTSRSKGDKAIPMAGVPVRAVDTYLERLVRGGYKVAICEQVQDPREAKGVVDRDVVRVLTPGTLTEDNLLEGSRPNHLAAAVTNRGHAGIAWIEISTGSFLVTECPESRMVDELSRIDPAEILIAEDAEALQETAQAIIGTLTSRPAFEFGRDSAERALNEFFEVATLEGFGVIDMPLAVAAAGALIGYLRETQKAALPHIRSIEVHHRSAVMTLDRATRASLEIVDTMRGDGVGTPLLHIIDRTHTPMGARLLRERLLSPLTDPTTINERLDAVDELHDRSDLAANISEQLSGILDLQRLTARICTGRSNARDLIALKNSLLSLPPIRTELSRCKCGSLAAIAQTLDPLDDLARTIGECIVDEPPLTLREGGMIRSGYHDELDELLTMGRDSKQWMSDFQMREAERTGIANLRVGFNKVFGYYIEITHGNRHIEVPAEYVRKQTTKNAERYVTEQLKEFEKKALDAEERSRNIEYDLFCTLRDHLAGESARLQETAALVAEIDVYTGLAVVARERDYHRPVVDDSHLLEIEDGRHPVIEATHTAGTFVPNDTQLDPPSRQLVLLTGPNMAGKSTYIRQNALIALLAQTGSFVPAKTAKIGVIDRIYTRVGASDDISRGQSTFMVEMTETANILNNASSRSLVILDEVGRGTSTFDGLALAWAIVEDLHDRIGCRTLFATHYHQLMDLAEPEKGIVNQRVAVSEWGDEIVFLHRIEDGGTDRSYGLHVGRLAGLPRSVLERARKILLQLEDEGVTVQGTQPEDATDASGKQGSLFEPPRDKMAHELQKLDLESTTPLDALQKLAQWRRLLDHQQ